MRGQMLPFEAILSIRKLQSTGAFSLPPLSDEESSSCILVPPVWLGDEHIQQARVLAGETQLAFSYFLEDIRIENLQKFLRHIHQGDRLLVLIDQLPKPQQIEILKHIWQADVGEHLFVTLKEGQDWPFEEGLKSLPWFLRDRIFKCSQDLFFSNELIQFQENVEKVETFSMEVTPLMKFVAKMEVVREEWSFRFWCSPHWTFQVLRFLRGKILGVFSILWYLKVPFEYVYWRAIPRLSVLYRFVKSNLWRFKKPFEFVYWQIKSRIWLIPVWYQKMCSHLWKAKLPYYFVLQHAWKWKLVYIKIKILYWQGYSLGCRSRTQLVYVWSVMLFPMKKCYWFARFQFRKRILGEFNP